MTLFRVLVTLGLFAVWFVLFLGVLALCSGRGESPRSVRPSSVRLVRNEERDDAA